MGFLITHGLISRPFHCTTMLSGIPVGTIAAADNVKDAVQASIKTFKEGRFCCLLDFMLHSPVFACHCKLLIKC